MNKNNCLVIDIETSSEYDIKDSRYIDDAKVKWIGMYSYEQDAYSEIQITDENKEQIIKFINKHRYLISFNGNKFDIPILKNNGFITNEYMGSIDLWEVLSEDGKNRGALMGYDFRYNSLKEMARVMGLETQKGDIDWRVFGKETLSEEEKDAIIKYLHADVAATKEMFDKVYDFWKPLTAFISEKNKRNFSWIKCSAASLTYKAMCNMTNLEEEYGQGHSERGIGARVIEPKVDEAWDVFYVDVTSLYPNIFIMFNLCSDGHGDWKGNEIFKVEGCYDDKNLAPMTKVLTKMVQERIRIKKEDPKNPMVYAYKILINSFYGISRNPVFHHVFTQNGGADCCRIGQEINKIMERMLNEKGYDVLAGDTDSCFPKPKEPKTYDDVMRDLQDIVDYINKFAPFPQPTFKIDIEHKLDYIMFAKDGDKALKKNYAYIYTDKEGKKHVEIKGMPIIKSTATALGQFILEKHIKPRMIEDNCGKFEKKWVKGLIAEAIEEDITLLAQEYKCQPYATYSIIGKRSIWAQVSNSYLNGEGGFIKLIKNKRHGKVGSGKWNYCTIDEAKGLAIDDVDLTKVLNELQPFIKEKKQVGLMGY